MSSVESFRTRNPVQNWRVLELDGKIEGLGY